MDWFVNDLRPSGASKAKDLPSAPALQEVSDFGSNPGNLRMHLFVPGAERQPRPLVIVLHGCTQTVTTYDQASGWSRLAVAHDFLLLMPAQKSENNFRTCFSWFEPADIRREGGEAQSIRQMIARVSDDHAVDPSRIFVCGLSAGGAMACAMLAAYPEIFAGGAVIAGLPYRAASGVGEAMECMQTGRIKDSRAWGDCVRTASAFEGPWPPIAIWHGTSDQVVKPINAGELIKQWTNVHGVGADAPEEQTIGVATRRIWRDAEGRACVTHYSLPGLGHGAPVDDPESPAPFFLSAGLSSTQLIAEDWGLTEPRRRNPLSFLSAILG